jgi:adenine deaminase
MKRTCLAENTKLLVNTAIGREKADLVVKGGMLVNVDTREILENVDIVAKEDRIALVGEAEHTVGRNTKIIDAKGKYVVPGFLDGHVHVESSMLTLTRFAQSVIPHGTTTVFIDPHEIANVLGLQGVKHMIDEAKNLPLRVFVCIPSCVPAAPDFETSGATLSVEDVAEALKWEGVIGLGEVMNYPAVLECEKNVHSKIQASLSLNKVVEGHANSLLNTELAAYASAGISSCHESTRAIDGVQRLRLGMYAMVREASGWRDLAEVIKCITVHGLDSRHVCLVTDDRDCETLLTDGHMDAVVRRAIEEGVDPIVAVQMATLNMAEHFGVSRDIGSIAPSKHADIAILDDLAKVKVNTVISSGVVVAKDGKLATKLVQPKYSAFLRNTVHLKRLLRSEDFVLKAPFKKDKVKAHVIGVVEGKAITQHLERMLPSKDGQVVSSTDKDIIKVAVIERHKRSGNIGIGLVEGFGLKEGAIASSVAHDSHNIIVIGVCDSDMAKAVNVLASVGGGIVAVHEGKTLGLIELPIAGLMSEKQPETVYEESKRLQNAWKRLGCRLKSPFMSLSLLALPVLPEIRITDKGLVDTKSFKFLSLFMEYASKG